VFYFQKRGVEPFVVRSLDYVDVTVAILVVDGHELIEPIRFVGIAHGDEVGVFRSESV